MEKLQKYQKINNVFKVDELTHQRTEQYSDIEVEYLKDNKWLCTEKIDGTNIRIVWDGYKFSILGRTEKSQVPAEIINLFTEKFNYNMEVIFEQKFGEKFVVLFLEGHGGNIQRGAFKEELPTQIVGFDVMIDGYYTDRMNAKDIFNSIGIPYVPYFYVNNLQEAIDYVLNNNDSILHPNNPIEGLVCTPAVPLNFHDKRIITKIKRNYLLDK